MTDIHSFLAQTFLFNSFSDREIEILTAAVSLKKIGKGEQIFSEGLEATAFFIVTSGTVKIVKLSSLLGTIPETLSRTLSFFKQQKLITEKDNTIIVSDTGKLKLFAD